MQTKQMRSKRPPIILIDSEADVLSELALRAQRHSAQVSALLLEEIERAKSSRRDRIPADVVTMMSQVEFIDERTGETHEVQLVFPADADAAAHRISILTPIGAGLIGLRSGQTIRWPNRAGDYRCLKILKVTQPPALAAY